MNHPSSQRRRLLLAAGALPLTIATPSFAQSGVTKLVVGFAAGGPLDAVARLIAPALGKELGTQVIVENKPGANAAIAAESVAKAPADGKQLWITSVGAVAMNPTLYDKLPYHPVRDLAPVSLVVNTVEILVVGANHPAHDAADFIARARQRKEGATLGSSGTGSVPHLAAELLADVTGARIAHVPYKGVAPAIADTMAGHIDGLFADVPVVLELIRSGKLKALGIAAPQRHPALPNVKTFQEQGIQGVDSDNWYAVFAAKATPAAELERLSQAMRRALTDPDVKTRLAATGLQPAPTTPAELARLLAADTAKWSKVIRDKKIRAE
ncbi:Bug family tripartite tricarboxylate transporter substrate binding protein [Hydrogenophaga sp. BPS33]|uniref:Bug family tripartite tricarboxylate transporter substrate binding protein n=1 Tax=Hydrogenophaga sp. BPS33 TaxID=2651974 RepID=UPI0013202881|nr:tripartite tricarboxylate transporter substrate binding protein [Hydrogenophaga sp. BPS33]QHE83507.1 tripartite tricarboxylate transporter substrate binding protein [Hydrogenophaga sp. BPS33]